METDPETPLKKLRKEQQKLVQYIIYHLQKYKKRQVKIDESNRPKPDEDGNIPIVFS
jgi:hypothetical protein